MLKALLLSLLSLGGCSGKGALPPPPDGGGDTAQVDTGGPAPALGCEETGVVQGVSAEVLDAVKSVVRVRWTTDSPTAGQVLFGSSSDYGMATAAEAATATDHEALLLGLAVNSRYHYRVIVGDGSVDCSADATVETGSLPSSLAEVSISELDPARAAGGYTAVPILGADLGSATAALFDQDGSYSWYYPYEDNLIFRVRVSLDRQRVLFNGITQALGEEGSLYRVSWDTETVERIGITDLHNDFVELPGGDRYAGLQWELKEYEVEGETRKIVGSRIIEFDSSGSYDVIWDIFDDLEPDLSQHYEQFLEDEGIEDWSHLNTLYYDAASDAYLTTSLYQDSLLSVDRSTGHLNWVMGGRLGDIPLDSGSMVAPHSVVPIDGRYLVFQHNEPTECSRASIFSVDPDALTASEDWTYSSDDCLLVYFLGSAEPLWNGNLLVTWSTSGQLDEITADGELVWRLRADLGTGFGFGTPIEGLYP